jgi:hypothetical protein
MEERESTEADISFEGDGILVFVEAKLYSPLSQADPPAKPYNQIARKLRVGTRVATDTSVEFFFVLLDIAPPQMLSALRPNATMQEALHAKAKGFDSKWLTAFWFEAYKYGTDGTTSSCKRFSIVHRQSWVSRRHRYVRIWVDATSGE